MHDINAEFWENPPWGDGKEKYRLGLSPISKEEWLNRKISPKLLKHKKHLLDTNYSSVIAVTDDSLEAQEILSKEFNVNKRSYPDLIADMSLNIQDDLCLIRSNNDQELLAVGKMAQPLPTSKTTDTTILVNIDRQ